MPSPRLSEGPADLIVVGAGTAGLVVALTAAENGARVLLLEKTDRIGGTLWLSSAQFSGGGTRLQRRRGIVDSPRDHFEDILRIGHGKQDRTVAWLACREAPSAIDWLDEQGFPFAPNVPVITFVHEPYRVPRTYWGVEGGKSLLSFLSAQLQPHLDSGAVDLRLGTSVEHLLVEDRQVVGVVEGGVEHRARAVVLATGGYAANEAMMQRFTSRRRVVTLAAPSSTGDGLLLAEAAGATIVGAENYLPTVAGIEDPDRPGRWLQRAPDTWDVIPVLVPQVRRPAEIWVNANGQRFVREDEPSIDLRERAVRGQPDMAFWVVTDEATLSTEPPLLPIWPPEEMRRLASEGRLVQQAQSIQALASQMGVPPAALEETVSAYNAAILESRADPFGKEYRPRPLSQPPFYAIRMQAMDLVGWAGLKVDGDLRVLRADGTPIVGLYAVGEILGASAFMGDAFCGGMMVGPCLALGRYLGARLARASASEEDIVPNRAF